MLQFMRSKASSWVVKILFGFLILSFAAWGIGDVFRNAGKSGPVATVGDVEITGQDLDSEVQQRLNQARQRGFQGSIADALALGLVDQVLQNMIDRVVIDKAARDAGLRVSDEVVIAQVQKNDMFHGPDGKFSKDRLQQMLALSGLSSAQFFGMMKQQIAADMLTGAVNAGAHPPAVLKNAIYRDAREKRAGESLFFADAKQTAGAPDDAAITSWYQAHADSYMAPEYRAFQLVVGHPADFAAAIPVSEDDLAAEYEHRKDEFSTPERRQVTQIVLDDMESAQKAAAELAAGGDFNQVAEAHDSAALPLDSMTRKAFTATLPELAEAVFALPEGGLTPPVESAFGVHIVRVDHVYPGSARTLDEVREKLLADLKSGPAADKLAEAEEHFGDSLNAGNDLATAAEEVGLKAVDVPALDATGRLPDGSAGPDTATLAEILQEAFAQNRDEEPTAQPTPLGGFFALKVTELQPRRQKTLEEVKDQVVADIMANDKAKAAEAAAEAASKALAEGADAARLAADTGAELKAIGPLDRTDRTLAPELLKQLFELQEGGATALPVDGGWIAARLAHVIPETGSLEDDPMAGFKDQLAGAMAQDMTAQLLQALRQKYDVEIHQDRIQSIYAQATGG